MGSTACPGPLHLIVDADGDHSRAESKIDDVDVRDGSAGGGGGGKNPGGQREEMQGWPAERKDQWVFHVFRSVVRGLTQQRPERVWPLIIRGAGGGFVPGGPRNGHE